MSEPALDIQTSERCDTDSQVLPTAIPAETAPDESPWPSNRRTAA